MKIIFCLLLFVFIFIGCFAQSSKKEFTSSFMQDSCTFETTGRNNYFILEPGYQLVLERSSVNGKKTLVITVLNETKKVNGVDTRVVEEHESLNGNVIEISRNFFAICKQTGSVFYFGEEVDNYKKGEIAGHEGAWLAEGKNKAGIMMPGLALIGARFYNEIAPGTAMDRLEIISTADSISTAESTFYNCIKLEETTPLEPHTKDYKIYALEIGLVKDGNLLLVKHGFVK